MNALTPALPAALSSLLAADPFRLFYQTTHSHFAYEETQCKTLDEALRYITEYPDRYLATLLTAPDGSCKWTDQRAEAAAWAAEQEAEDAEETDHIASLRRGYLTGLGVLPGRAA